MDLGLHLDSAGTGAAQAVTVVSASAVAMVRADLNGHDLTARFRTGVLNQTMYLGGDEGLRAGSNTEQHPRRSPGPTR